MDEPKGIGYPMTRQHQMELGLQSDPLGICKKGIIGIGLLHW